MTLQTLLIFIVSMCLISASPGPNMILAFQFGLNYGVKRTLLLLAGQLSGIAALYIASIFIISGIAIVSSYLFSAFQIVGAIYLIYIGIQAWIYRAQSFKESKTKTKNAPWPIFRCGIMCSLSNPKTILVMSAFIPKFIHPKRHFSRNT